MDTPTIQRGRAVARRWIGLVLVMLVVLVQAGLRPTQGQARPMRGLPAGLTAQDWSAIRATLPPEMQAYLKASNTGTQDYFGRRVALSGDTLVVSAPGESSAATGVNGNQQDDSAWLAGAVYVLVRSSSGGSPTWSQQAYLKASNTEADDYFGWSIAVDGDTIVVGALREDSAATGVNGDQTNNSAQYAGAAYVFVRSDAQGAPTWSQQAYLKASNTDAEDNFGSSVAIAGDTILVGAINEASAATGINGNQQDNSAMGAGAVYMFVRSDAQGAPAWSQQAYLKASNTDAGDSFGSTIAIDGETIVVGAGGEDSAARGVNGNQADNSARLAGAAYVFTRPAGASTWSQQAYLKASNTDAEDNFGSSVAIAGDLVVVGAPFEDNTGVNGDQIDTSIPWSGAAYIFLRTGTGWSQQAYLKATSVDIGDSFGGAVAIDGATVIVGALLEDSAAIGVNGNQFDNSVPSAGAAFVFLPTNTQGTPGWSLHAYLKASNTESNDVFGSGVAVDGTTIVVGAYGEASSATGANGDQTDNSALYSGAVYVFEHASRIYLPLVTHLAPPERS